VAGRLRHGIVSSEPPTDGEKLLQTALLSELSFDVRNQILPLLVHLVLHVEKRAALLVALGFEGFEGEEVVAEDEAVLEQVARIT
jgi:hypothetical protein